MKLKKEQIWTILVVLTVSSFWLGNNGLPEFFAFDFSESDEFISEDVLLQKEAEANREEKFFITVHIAGEVNTPGVYKLEEEARVIDGIIAAGGETDAAYLAGINLAKPLHEGEQIIIPDQDGYSSDGRSRPDPDQNKSELIAETNSSINAQAKININRADADTLMTLTGIGQVKASDIIAHREKNGQFSSTEELLHVKGIGDVTFSSIKDKITVR